ncbi:hypothetical protein CHS0354_024727 [Potamilus streckersoni]|uniref:Hydroxysteroid dehydrogenase-like protein 2 n=1 Tax=Potamilus streckersoni TaxID=2493646 RepID=A0AAE0RX59_9BIVA|nr:hypothetical protein CHS0354_024727 [Potamilus streckersoni]
MKTALVIGASRGIGRQIVLTLSENGYQVGVAAKTTDSSDQLPGSIYTVIEETKQKGGIAYPFKCNARNEQDIRSTVQGCISRFGHLDVAIYNAGAITWKPVLETPLKRFELMNEVNIRGAYIMIQEVLPHFLNKKRGRIVLVSPPIYSRFFKGKVPYSVSKVGLSILTMGLSHEIKGTGVTITSLWPTTAIKSHVTDVNNIPDRVLRKPEIFADAVLKIVEEKTDKLNGKCLLDEDYLRSEGMTDFTKYRCDPDHEPPRMMPRVLPDLTVSEEDESLDSKL